MLGSGGIDGTNFQMASSVAMPQTHEKMNTSRQERIPVSHVPSGIPMRLAIAIPTLTTATAKADFPSGEILSATILVTPKYAP